MHPGLRQVRRGRLRGTAGESGRLDGGGRGDRRRLDQAPRRWRLVRSGGGLRREHDDVPDLVRGDQDELPRQVRGQRTVQARLPVRVRRMRVPLPIDVPLVRDELPERVRARRRNLSDQRRSANARRARPLEQDGRGEVYRPRFRPISRASLARSASRRRRATRATSSRSPTATRYGSHGPTPARARRTASPTSSSRP